METENWLPIENYEGLYEISDLGRIKNTRTQRILKFSCNGRGYPQTALSKEGIVSTIRLHKLVALAFIGPKPSPEHQINHIDGVKTNAKATNLEWVTQKENLQHAKDLKLHTRGRFFPGGKKYAWYPGMTASCTTKQPKAKKPIKRKLMKEQIELLSRIEKRSMCIMHKDLRMSIPEIATEYEVSKAVVSYVLSNGPWK